jgi:uncharacterized Zn ribbon protein
MSDVKNIRVKSTDKNVDRAVDEIRQALLALQKRIAALEAKVNG